MKYTNFNGFCGYLTLPSLKPKIKFYKALVFAFLFMSYGISFGQCDVTNDQTCTNLASLQSTVIDLSNLVCDGSSSSSFTVESGGLYALSVSDLNTYSFTLTPTGDNLVEPIFPGVMDLFLEADQFNAVATSGPIAASAGLTPNTMTYTDNGTRSNDLFLAIWDKSCDGSWKDYTLSVTCISCSLTCAPRQVIAGNETGCVSQLYTFAAPTFTGPCVETTLELTEDNGTGATLADDLVTIPAGTAAGSYTLEFAINGCADAVASTCTTEVVIEPSSSCSSGNINLSSLCSTQITAENILTNKCAANDQYTIYINDVNTDIVLAAGTYQVAVRYTPTVDAIPNGTPDTSNPFYDKELCSQSITFEDKSGPSCDLADADTEYNFITGFETATATPTYTDCSGTVTENAVLQTTVGDCGEIDGVTTDADNDLLSDFDTAGIIIFNGMSIPAPSEAEADTLSAAGFALERIVVNSFSATDGTTTGSTCEQYIYFWRATTILTPGSALITCGLETTTSALALLDPKLVPYYANPLYDGTADTSTANDFSSTNIEDATFVSTKVDDNGNPEFVAITGQDHTVLKFIVTSEDGTTSTPCGNTTKFVRRYTVLDCCTNTILIDNVSQYIETIDNVAPAFTECPTGTDLGTITNPIEFVISESNTCATTVDFAAFNLTATDDCSNSIVYSVSFFDLGTTTTGSGTLVGSSLTADLDKGNYRADVTATDDCGNVSAICNVYLNVEDKLIPTVSCVSSVVAVDNNGNATICASSFASASDNCGTIDSLLVRKMVDGVETFAECINISCDDAVVDSVGNQVVLLVYKAVDDSGNSNISMCSVQIKVTSIPVFTCPADVTVSCTEFDALDPTTLYGSAPTVDGICDQMFTTTFTNMSSQTGSCSAELSMTRRYYLLLDTVVVDSCDQTIFVEDNIAPTFDSAVSDISVECDAIPVATDITATDTCPEGTVAAVTFVETRADGACTDSYSITRVFTATDECGNAASSTQVITVSDTTDPTFDNTPADMSVTCSTVLTVPTVTASDNCDTDVQVDLVSVTSDPVTCPNESTVTRTWTATDNCGNTAVQTQVITITSEDIVVTRMPDASVDCDMFDGFTFTEPTITYPCAASTGVVVTMGTVDSTDIDAAGNRTKTATFTVTDDCGFSQVFTTVITFTGCCIDLETPTPQINCAGTRVDITINLAANSALSISEISFTVTNRSDATDTQTQAGNNIFVFTKLSGTVIYDIELTPVDATVVLCSPVTTAIGCFTNRIAGRVFNEEFVALEEVEVELMNTEIPMSMTDVDGEFNFEGLEDQSYTVAAHKESDPLNGISTFDLVIMAQHVLDINLLDSPYKVLAADINMDEKIDVRDMLELRQLILFSIQDFTINTSWRFVNADYIFPDAQNPWLETIPETYRMEALSADTEVNFIAVKIGDLDCSAATKTLTTDAAPREAQTLVMNTTDQSVKAGNTFDVVLSANQELTLSAVQFTLNFDPTLASLDGVSSDALALKEGHISQKFSDEGLVPFAWYTHEEVDFTPASDITLTFTAKQDLSVANFIDINSTLTEAMAYTPEGIEYDLSLQVVDALEQDAKDGFMVYQNQPNPFHTETLIAYEVAVAETVQLTVFDIDGKLLYTTQLAATSGYNSVVLTKDDIQKTGVLFYQIDAAEYTMTKKMIILE